MSRDLQPRLEKLHKLRALLEEAIQSGQHAEILAVLRSSELRDHVYLGRASMLVSHKRPDNWITDPKTGLLVPDPDSYKLVDDDEEVHNVITNAGRVWMHGQCYGTSGLGTNGLNYIALSNDTLTETSASTTLSTEIAANGLSRAQGTVTLATGSGNQTTIDKTFTCATGAQAAQKAALFSASSSGTMNHALAFTQRSLQVGDTLQTTYTITLG